MENERIIELLETIAGQNAEIIRLLTRRKRQREHYQTEQEQERETRRTLLLDYVQKVMKGRDRIRRGELYEAVREICRANMKPIPGRNALYKMVMESGYSVIKSNGEIYFTR